MCPQDKMAAKIDLGSICKIADKILVQTVELNLKQTTT